MTHASCSVLLSDDPTIEHLDKLAESTKAQIDKLRKATVTDSAYRFNNSMIYRMVDSLAKFHKDFRGLQEVLLDSKEMAAASKIDLKKVKRSNSQKFYVHPAHLDAFCQLAGFIMNANDNADLDREVFVNHGWDSLRLYEDINPTQIYYAWAQMARGKGAIWHGSLTILRDDKVVAEIQNINVSLGPGYL